jgi:hypothetical protein
MANYKVKAGVLGSVGFNSKSVLLWDGAAQVANASKQTPVSFINPVKLDGSVKGAIEAVQNEICAGNPVILKLEKQGSDPEHPKNHFVLVEAIDLDGSKKQTLRLLNPGTVNGNGQFYSSIASSYPKVLQKYVYHSSLSDPSMIDLSAPPDVDFVVTDPLGRRTGFDPIAKVTYDEIPEATYYFESVNTPAESDKDEVFAQEQRFMSWGNAIDGTYSVEVFSLTDEDYYLDYRSTDMAGNFNDAVYKTGHLSSGQSAVVIFTHSSKTMVFSNAALILRDVLISKVRHGRSYDKANVKISGKIETDGEKPLVLKSQFRVTIGGVTGYSLDLRGSEFKSVHHRGRGHMTGYIYRKRDLIVEISSSGDFSIQIDGANLSTVDASQLGQIQVEVDSTVADAAADLTCHGNTCRLYRVHGHESCHKSRGHR